jgi:hypothetical protein
LRSRVPIALLKRATADADARLMRRALTALAALATLGLTVRAGASMEPGLDYYTDASDSIDSIVRGDWSAFFANQPLMGSFSLLVRAPFVAPVFHAQLDTVYFAGALPCILATAILGLALARVVADQGQPPAVQGLVAGLAVINPITFRALHWGHPEELLGGALCVGAVLAALRERELLAGVLLGLALATKQWAVLAVLPTLLAAPHRRLVLATVAGAVAAALTLPLLLANTGQFESVAATAAGQVNAAASTTPWNVWWPLASLTDFQDLGERWMAPGWVPTVAHPTIVLLALPLSALAWRRRDRRPDDALLLLALLFLLRCLLDNWNNEYYHAPFLLSLLAWEVVRRPGVPRLTLVVTALIGLSFWPQVTRMYAGTADAAPWLFAGYMAWALPLAAGLALTLYRPNALRQYHRRRGAPACPAAVRDRAGARGDRELDRATA